MNVALLFDWKAYDHVSNYWDATRAAVFGTGLIQRSGRHMKLAVGDLIVGHGDQADPARLYEVAFWHSKWRLVREQQLADAFPTVFVMMFENMPSDLATDLHHALQAERGYLGAVSVHFEYPPHLVIYRAHLPPRYRVKGQALRSFYTMGNEDERDEYELEEMRRLGYADLGFEDRGASRTILDDFDTPRHFQRVAAFRDLMTSALTGGEDAAYELVMVLEDLSPKLFNALGAASERLANAETDEELAQVAISARRYLEQLADALFSPSDAKRNGRDVTKEAYRNRLWAFVEDNASGDPTTLKALGSEVDRLVLELNRGVHGAGENVRIAVALADVATLTSQLFSLNDGVVRQPYQPYRESILTFFKSSLTENSDEH
ncbi:hypothetical protein N0B44_28890 [Roseibacterium beibuensis]|uniref:hypothetical protein n=1 Tax=[Roseibacterium] beibuensis TaxID=1193142 RepID=UPI00217EF3D4|nr:hypothetical protein [Roseibacterium beibuensis]MCS6626941.1 hypothetical protein [Roseibacterium beibuensis]